MEKNFGIINLDHYYLEIEDKLNAVSAYAENKNVSTILKICRFKPYPIKPKTSLHKLVYKHWVDDYGNSIEIKNKRIIIKTNDLKINKDDIISTDLYKGLDISKLLKISKLIYIFRGREVDFKTDHFILSFMGLDNYLRSYSFLYDEWHPIPSIYLGVNVLNTIIDNSDIQTFKSFKMKNTIIFDCENQQSIIGKIPFHKFFMEEIKKEYEQIEKLLQEGINV